MKADITYAMSAFSIKASSPLYRVGDDFVSASLPPYSAGDAEIKEGMSCLQDVHSYIQEWTICMHGILSLIKKSISVESNTADVVLDSLVWEYLRKIAVIPSILEVFFGGFQDYIYLCRMEL